MASVPPKDRSPPTLVGARGPRSLGGVVAQQFQLVRLDGEGAGTPYPLMKDAVRVGKAADNDLVLDHPTVSRNHLVLRRQEDGFVAQDLGSTNGTFVDGAQVQEARLHPGSVLELGDVRLRFSPLVAPGPLALPSDGRLGDLVGASLPMRQIFAQLHRVAPTDSTLLLVGETGTGKGAAAKAVHGLSSRASGPLVVFDCASVSDSLIESELFGHEKGAFTGAVSQRIGCLERASGGTLFLDEIDDLSLELQPKLLRALENRELKRVGGSASVSFNVRIIAASKKELWSETQAGRFREDLYFRLSVFTVNLPPLKERREDLPLLVDSFAGEPLWERLPEKFRTQFLEHTWPGNVRELRNALERVKHIVDIPELTSGNFLHKYTRETPATQGDFLPVEFLGPFKHLKEGLIRSFEREYLVRLLARAGGNIARAAREAELDRKHLYSLLHKYGLAQSG